MSENKITTSVKEVDFDSIIAEFDTIDNPKPANPGFNARPDNIEKVFDTPIVKTEPIVEKKEEPEVKVEKKEAEVVDGVVKQDSVFDQIVEPKEDEKEETSTGLLSVLEELTKEEIILPFDDEKPFDQYSKEDIKELFKANREHWKREDLEKEVGEFFESLPKEIQYAAKYVADGGTDLKGLFRALAATEEIKMLDVKQVRDRESIIREYYRAIDWGTEEEIQEEIDRIKELGDSEEEKFANKYKPKLEKMQEEVTKQHLERQERARALQEQEMHTYMDNANSAIISGKLGEITLDKKTQSSLWAGLTQPNYQTRRGAATNELGHLLEKYQYIEPDFEKVYKALWLLRDEKGFEEALARKLKNEVVSDTVRVLKTEQSKKTGTGVSIDKQEDNSRPRKVISRQQPKFLSGLK